MIARARRGRTLLLALCALCWSAFPAYASDESPANRLFVEAAKLIRTAAEEAGGARKVELLKRARHKMEAIVDSHPSSGLAVKLISGQKIGTVSLAGLDDEIEAAVVHACLQAPTPDCVFSIAVVTAKTIEKADRRALVFFWIAEAQAKAGCIAEAFATAKMIEHAVHRVGAFIEIASVQINEGDAKRAGETFDIPLETAKMIDGARRRTEVFIEIAAAQTKKGDIERARAIFGIALETAKTIESVYSHV